MAFPGKNTGVNCHPLLQRIFPNQVSNLWLLHCRQILYHWATREDENQIHLLRTDYKLYKNNLIVTTFLPVIPLKYSSKTRFIDTNINTYWIIKLISPRLKTLPLHYRAENGREALLCAQHHAEQLWGQRLSLKPQSSSSFSFFTLFAPCQVPKVAWGSESLGSLSRREKRDQYYISSVSKYSKQFLNEGISLGLMKVRAVRWQEIYAEESSCVSREFLQL